MLAGGPCHGLELKLSKALPIRQFLLTNLIRTDKHNFRLRIPIKILGSALDNMGYFPFKISDNVRFCGPTLVIRGSRSSYVPDVSLPVIQQLFPRSTVQDIDSGHWVISERPEAFRHGMTQCIIQGTSLNS